MQSKRSYDGQLDSRRPIDRTGEGKRQKHHYCDERSEVGHVSRRKRQKQVTPGGDGLRNRKVKAETFPLRRPSLALLGSGRSAFCMQAA